MFNRDTVSDNLPLILMSITIIFWGFSWPIGHIVASSFGKHVFTAAFIRFSIALPTLVLITKFIEGDLQIDKSMHWRIMILGFLQITIYNFLYLSGLRFTSSSDASLIIAINPTLTALFSSQVYDDEKLNPKRILGLILAFSGVTLIFVSSPNTAVPNRILGDLLIFGGAIVWASYSTFSRPVYNSVSPLKFQVWATFYGWLALAIISIFEKPWDQTYEMKGILGLVYLGLFAAALANTFFSFSIKHIGPTKTSIFVNMVPVIGVISSIFLLGDKFSLLYVAAFILIFFGVRTVNRS